MNVRVEFYGIPRERAGVDALEVPADNLEAALSEVAARLPRLAETCLRDGRLRDGYLANINGEQFTRDPATPLCPGDTVLILSADAGG